ncbi:MAG: phosphate signaling complex protein PhoU [Alphaproteobacteria bacterium]
MKEHIVSTYDEDLSLLKSNLIEMGLNCEKQLFNAINITRIISIEKANEIIKNDHEIDIQERKIRELATTTLSKRQPLADDLRRIIIALKISSILERIGDHASNIAGRILHVKKAPESYLTDSIFQLGKLVIKNFSNALSSYDQESQKIAQIVPTEDITINSVYETCFREHLHLMMEEPKIIGFCTQMLFIAKELERIGDLSKVISKEVIYNLKGKLVKR